MDHGGKTAADTAADEEDRPVLGLLLDAGCTKRRHCPPVQAKLTQTMVLQSLLQTTCSWLQPCKPNRLRCRGEMPQQSASNDIKLVADATCGWHRPLHGLCYKAVQDAVVAVSVVAGRLPSEDAL